MTIWTRLAEYSHFETQRLLLRPFVYSDWQDFYKIVSNPQNLPFIFASKADKREAQELMVELFIKEPLGKWAIVDKKSQQLIGAISFEKLDIRTRQAELGYFIRKDFWNQGFATEAVKNISFLAFELLDLAELSIVAHLENAASQKVALKAGFSLLRQYKGSDRYTHQMRMYRQYYLSKNTFKQNQNKEENEKEKV